MNRREFLKRSGFAAGLVLAGCAGPQFSKMAPGRPNIIVVLADDMGFSDLNCYGGEIDTPNINSLAKNGVRFTQFYNAARCCPTRASLLTGLYPHKTGVGYMTESDYGYPGYRAELNNNCVTIAEALKLGGYRTYMAGKWHVCKDFAAVGPKHNWPMQRGFEKFFGTLIAAGSQWDPITLVEGNDFITPSGDFFYTEEISNKAIEYIDRHNSDKPFFLYIAHTAPHWPLHARSEMIAKYRGRFSEGWDKLRENRLERQKKMGIVPESVKLSPRDEVIPAWDGVEHKQWQQSRMEAYAAMVEHIDEGMGKLVKKLEEKDQLDNTLIFFLSDNGGDSLEHLDGMIGSTGYPWAYMRYVPLYTRDGRPIIAGDYPGVELGPDDTYGGYGINWASVSNSPFQKYKKYAHEGGISTPLIVHWPDKIKEKNVLRHQCGHVVDIMATCLDAAGVEYPKSYKGNEITPLDGKSLLAVCENDTQIHSVLCWEHDGHRGVRKGKWKIAAVSGGAWQLYDMSTDRTETTDLAEKYPEITAELEGLYNKWADECGVIPVDKLKQKQGAMTDKNPLRRSPQEVREYLEKTNEVFKERGLKPIEVDPGKL